MVRKSKRTIEGNLFVDQVIPCYNNPIVSYIGGVYGFLPV